MSDTDVIPDTGDANWPGDREDKLPEIHQQDNDGCRLYREARCARDRVRHPAARREGAQTTEGTLRRTQTKRRDTKTNSQNASAHRNQELYMDMMVDRPQGSRPSSSGAPEIQREAIRPAEQQTYVEN